MTVVTHIPDAAAAAAEARHELVVGLTDAGIFFETHLGAELPASPLIQKRVEGDTYAEKITRLHEIAKSWGVPVQTLPDGSKYAELVFGPLTIAANVSPDDKTLTGYFARMARARAAQGGTGAAA